MAATLADNSWRCAERGRYAAGRTVSANSRADTGAVQGLLVKASYWRWPDHDRAGNAIDFYIEVLGLSFHDAMKELLAK
jgi:hypothetical protein